MAARESVPPERRWWDSTAIVSSLTAVVVMIVSATAAYVTQRAIRNQEFALTQGDGQLERLQRGFVEAYSVALGKL